MTGGISKNVQVKNIEAITDCILLVMNNTKDFRELYVNCLTSYFNDAYFSTLSVTERYHKRVLDFFEENGIDDKVRKEMLYEILEVMIYPMEKLGTPIEVDPIVLMDVMLVMVNLLILTSPLNSSPRTFPEAIEESRVFMSYFNQEVTTAFEENSNEIEKVLVNHNALIREVVEIMKDQPFTMINRIIFKSDSKRCLYAMLDYDLPNIRKTRRHEIEEILSRYDTRDKFGLIAIEQEVFKIYKHILNGYKNNEYFLEVPKNYFDRKVNFQKMHSLMTIPGMKQRLYFVLNYSEYVENCKRIADLKEQDYLFAVSKFNKLDKNVNLLNGVVENVFTDLMTEVNIERIKKYTKINGINLYIKDEKDNYVFLNNMTKESGDDV